MLVWLMSYITIISLFGHNWFGLDVGDQWHQCARYFFGEGIRGYNIEKFLGLYIYTIQCHTDWAVVDIS